MLVAETYLGHRSEVATDDPERVVLTETERRRSRVRTESESGRDLGIVVSRELRDGDVLEAEEGTRVLVELAAVEALVVDLAAAGLSPASAVELGHHLGNRHRDIAVRDGDLLVAVGDSRERTRAVVADLVAGDPPTRVESVPPDTFDDVADHGEHGHSHGGHDHGVRTVDGGEP